MKINQVKAIVTGGSTGIGYEIAKQLKQQGAEVIICARTKADVEKVKSELGVAALVTDVSVQHDVEQLFTFALQQMSTVNTVVNNAGIAYLATLTDTTLSNFTKVWEVNVQGAFLVGQMAARHFIAHQIKGNIINIASTAGRKGFATGTAYCASKFALTGMTECWRAELRPHNIRVMQINPSEVITPLIEKLGNTPTNVEKKLKPSEIAHTVLSMLAMDDVGFIPELSVWATNPN